jgi:hypothetical protein
VQSMISYDIRSHPLSHILLSISHEYISHIEPELLHTFPTVALLSRLASEPAINLPTVNNCILCNNHLSSLEPSSLLQYCRHRFVAYTVSNHCSSVGGHRARSSSRKNSPLTSIESRCEKSSLHVVSLPRGML